MKRETRCRITAEYRVCQGITLVLVIFFLAGCLWEKQKAPRQFQGLSGNAGPPRTVAILPFRDLTDTPGLAGLIRESLYGKFSILNYQDVELSVMDRKLGDAGIASAADLEKVPVGRLGHLLGCDAVLFGTIFEYQVLFAGIYSSISVGASIQIYDTRNKNQIWIDRETRCSREGGLPLSLIEVPFVTIRSGYHLRDDIKMKTIEELARNLVARIPRHPGDMQTEQAEGDGGGILYMIQTGAFREEPRATKHARRLIADGYPVSIREAREGKNTWYRVLIGPFCEYEKAMAVKNTLSERFGEKGILTREEAGFL